MAVVDSSALIPLAWVGRLDLLSTTFDELRTTEAVRTEVLTEGKRGTTALDAFLEEVAICETPTEATEVATLEGIAIADASVILLAEDNDHALVANDKGLIEVAQSHGVDCLWVTTLLLKCTKEGTLDSETATDLLYDLVNEGMNLHPKVYTQIQKKLREFDN
ncbi:hypothetical protein [Halostagnicola sp. A-GB9-2]|uniref:hypothetical protein n=1 Tax=Halostagnicola sp. A-GB9-2 TaxID=3048066 RepID=UPI0024C03D53|nr:hypothetical protein [Halostagnicola sp. A-GB9-2]MDJ1431935.1 hypothetical protein [Halostagnicola sp. A-GB9-2]